MGVEPTSTAWEAVVLPINYIRKLPWNYIIPVDAFASIFLNFVSAFPRSQIVCIVLLDKNWSSC